MCREISAFKFIVFIVAMMSMCGLDGTPKALAQEAGQAQGGDKAQREQELRQKLQKILDELDELKREPEGAAASSEQPSVVKEQVEPKAPGEAPQVELQDMSIISKRVQKRPEGVTLSATDPSETQNQPTRTLRESLESLPGVIVRQANGPRDFSISIRGSGVKTTFAVRDIKLYEDGIGQTQSDGLSRLDIHDPWFMRSVEVLSGASSSLYDNYALGGMVHFKTRRGADINGFESLFAGGSYGFQKYAFAVGQETANTDVALFASHQAEDGYIQWSGYDTQTLNFNFRFRADNRQSFYFKAISNWLDTKVPTRLTMDQYRGFARGSGGTTCTSTFNCNFAVRLNQHRTDRRTIIGGLYEREIDPNTVLTVEADYDVKDINQTFTQITDNTNPNWKHYTDLRHNGRLGDMSLRSYVGFFVNNMEQEGNTFANLDNYAGTRGTLAQNNRFTIRNIGGRFREELEIVPKWTLAAGFGFEQSIIGGQVTSYTAAGAVNTSANVNRTFYNYAPEVSLTFKQDDGSKYWTRISTGYGIPTIGNLTTDPTTGLAGTNFNLQPQKNVNAEIGTDTKLHKTLSVHLVGFYTYYRNEIINQTTPVGTFATNAPSSQYRGVEAGYDWRPAPGWRLSGAYTHIAANYMHFVESLSATSGQVDRHGKQVPNVARDVVNVKQAYDDPSGWGGWIETSYWGSYYLNNNNTVKSPGYWLWNANLHKTFEFKNNPYVKSAKFYTELQNVFGTKYAASGNVAADSTPDANKLLYFAGYGRAIYGGVTLGF